MAGQVFRLQINFSLSNVSFFEIVALKQKRPPFRCQMIYVPVTSTNIINIVLLEISTK